MQVEGYNLTASNHTNTTQFRFCFCGLSPNTEYSVQITPWNLGGRGPPAKVDMTTITVTTEPLIGKEMYYKLFNIH